MSYPAPATSLILNIQKQQNCVNGYATQIRIAKVISNLWGQSTEAAHRTNKQMQLEKDMLHGHL